jgi:hypothetical protein
MASIGMIISTGKFERMSTEAVYTIPASCKGKETLAVV